MAGRFGFIALLALLLAACTAEPDYSSIAPKDQIAYSAQFLEQIRTGAVDAALEQISDGSREAARPTIEGAAKNFPKQEVKLVRVVGYRAIPVPPGATGVQPVANIELRYEFADNNALVATIVLGSDSQRYYISFLNFTPLPAALIEQNSFPGPNASIGHYIYLLIAFVVVVFILATLYVCVRGPGPRWRWRWLWLLAIALGAIRFSLSMDWATGELAQAFGLVPFGFWLRKDGIYAPYFFTIGFPLGAILFWAMRSRWTTPKISAPAAVPPQNTPSV